MSRLGQRFLAFVYDAGRQAQVDQQNGGEGTKRHIKIWSLEISELVRES